MPPFLSVLFTWSIPIHSERLRSGTTSSSKSSLTAQAGVSTLCFSSGLPSITARLTLPWDSE